MVTSFFVPVKYDFIAQYQKFKKIQQKGVDYINVVSIILINLLWYKYSQCKHLSKLMDDDIYFPATLFQQIQS